MNSTDENLIVRFSFPNRLPFHPKKMNYSDEILLKSLFNNNNNKTPGKCSTPPSSGSGWWEEILRHLLSAVLMEYSIAREIADSVAFNLHLMIRDSRLRAPAVVIYRPANCRWFRAIRGLSELSPTARGSRGRN